jgi:hypothetical protein
MEWLDAFALQANPVQQVAIAEQFSGSNSREFVSVIGNLCLAEMYAEDLRGIL